MDKFKPTLRNKPTPMGKKYENSFNKITHGVGLTNLTEDIDGLLTEKEQSLKKKIFSLAKMEALVFSDPKLTAVYNEMAENGEEKYGYHYNETIQNMIFNDYILNSPKYLQKYKMAIPKEKKRRDASGINQLKKAGAKKMGANIEQPKLNTTPVPEKSVEETTGAGGVGAMGDGSGQYSAPLGTERKIEETTGTGGAPGGGANSSGSGPYSGPAVWGSGDLMKTKGKAKVKKIPAYHGGTFIEESKANYLIDPTGFERYINILNEEDLSYQTKLGKHYQETHTGSNKGLGVSEIPSSRNKGIKDAADKNTALYIRQDLEEMRPDDVKILHNDMTDKHSYFPHPENKNLKDDGISGTVKEENKRKEDNTIINDTSAFTSNTVKNWNKKDTDVEMNTLKTGDPDKANLHSVEEGNISPDAISTKEQLKSFLAMFKQRSGKSMTYDVLVPMLAGEALYAVAIQIANKMLPISWDELPDVNSMWDYINENGGMRYKDLLEAVKEAVNDRIAEEGMSLDDLQEGKKINEVPESEAQRKAAAIALHNPEKATGAAKEMAKSMDKEELHKLSMKPKGKKLPYKVKAKNENKKLNEYLIPDALIGNDIVDIKPQKGEKPFELNGGRFQYEIATYADGHKDNVVYSFKDDVYYDYRKFREAMGLGLDEETQSMIDDKPDTMANLATPANTQGGKVPTGTEQTGGMHESYTALLEEINNELDAFSIHHDKLKRMSEDRKPSALVLKDRLGVENAKNFKKDLKDSSVSKIVDTENALEYNDQQTEVDKNNPYKLGEDIEANAIKTGDMKSGEALKNVGNSTNEEGDEIPKRNLSKEEQDEVNLYRKGLGDFVYDNEPGKGFEDRMKKDMGDKLYKQRQDKLKFQAKAPMYNKEAQPTEATGVDKIQFDKEKSGWNKREGIKESIVSGKYFDNLGKKRIIDFKLNEVKELKTPSGTATQTGLYEVNLEGMGNTYTNKVNVNEGVVKAMNENKFYTDGKEVFVIKNPVQTLNEGDKKEKPVINEQANKMKHLIGYNTSDFVKQSKI